MGTLFQILACMLLALALAPSPSHARAQTLSLAPAEGIYDPAPVVDVLVDADGKLTIQDVLAGESSLRFTPLGGDVVATPATGNVWVRFQVETTTDDFERTTWVTGLDWPNFWDWYGIRNMQLYVVEAGSGTILESGSLIRDGRVAEDFSYGLPYQTTLNLQGGKTFQVFLQLGGDHLFLPLIIGGQDALAAERQWRNVLFGVYYGLMGALVLLGLSMYASIREKAFVLFSAYAMAEAAYYLCSNGLLFQALDLKHPFALGQVDLICIGLLAVTSGPFSRAFLRSREKTPFWDKAILAYMLAGVAVCVAALIAPMSMVTFVLTLSTAFGPFIIIIPTVILLRRGEPHLLFFLLAWIAWALGGVVAVLSFARTIPLTPEAFHSFQITSAMAAIFLTISLTERVRALQRQRDFAEAASRTKSDFLATMSHEIRTPLNTLLGMADLLSRETSGGSRTDRIKTMRHSGKHLLSVVNNILDFSKIEAGQLELESIPLDIEALAAQAASIMAVRTREKGLALQIAIHPDIRSIRTGDPARLTQVLVNLIGNAVKFTEQGRVELTVGPGPDITNRDTLLFTVTDTGIGIPRDKHRLIFESFSQTDSSTTRRFGGTGLGLAICKRIVAMMDGEIWVESEPGRGTTFLFTAVLPEAEPGVTLEWAQEEPDEATGLLPALCILLAEDIAANRELVRAYLEEHPVTMDEVENGLEAVEASAAKEYDVLLLDMEMPKMDGVEAVRAIRRREEKGGASRLPVVALTADAREDRRRLCLNAGCDVFLTKPVSRGRLIAAIAQATGVEASAPESEPGPLEPVSLDSLPEEVRPLAPGFVQYLHDAMDDLGKAAEAEDFEELFRLAHGLKGAARNFGFLALGKDYETLELHARDGNASRCGKTLKTIRTALGRIQL